MLNEWKQIASIEINKSMKYDMLKVDPIFSVCVLFRNQFKRHCGQLCGWRWSSSSIFLIFVWNIEKFLRSFDVVDFIYSKSHWNSLHGHWLWSRFSASGFDIRKTIREGTVEWWPRESLCIECFDQWWKWHEVSDIVLSGASISQSLISLVHLMNMNRFGT